MKRTHLQRGEIEQLATGFKFVEGPVWHKDGYWFFSDIPSNRIHTITPEGKVGIHREPSGNSNDLTFDRSGRLLACEHGNRRVSIAQVDSQPHTLADTFEDKRLNSPNDLVVHSSGAVYFTDPPYGIKSEEMEQEHAGVYRVGEDGANYSSPTLRNPTVWPFPPTNPYSTSTIRITSISAPLTYKPMALL
ncbi:MAG: SMP-30/gluconolactonase/LRE family protein [Candidatus Latescibacterota bacterium]